MAKEISPRQQCPSCAANGLDTAEDNLSVYVDGKFCQSCGYVEKDNKKEDEAPITGLIAGQLQALEDRKLSLKTCEKYNIRTTQYTGYLNGKQVTNEPVRILPYYKDGKVVKQKIKSIFDSSKQTQVGNTKYNDLFGKHLFSPSEKIPIIVTEGEEDAAAIFSMTGLPAVSIPNGAGKGKGGDLAKHTEWLSGFKEVILNFDADEPGQIMFEECVGLFEPGKVKKAIFPLKDANDMLKANRGEEVKRCLWNAEIIKPDTLVSIKEIRHLALVQPVYGMDWPWPSLTKATYGMRTGEIYLLAGPTSSGKTEMIRCIINHIISQEIKVGYFSFEQLPQATIQRFVSGALNKRIYLPGAEWDEEEINREIDKFEDSLHLYNPSSGHVNVETVIANIRFLHNCMGYRFFVIDNLKSLSLVPVIDGKRVASYEYASHAMGSLSMICRQLNINIFVINHLSEDKIQKQAYVSTSPKDPDKYLNTSSEQMQSYINRPGMEWETGRMANIGNIWAGGNCKDLTDYIIAIGRNRMSEYVEEQRTLRVRMLKTRLDSTYEGFEFRLKYNYETGNLEEDANYLDDKEAATANKTSNVLK